MDMDQATEAADIRWSEEILHVKDGQKDFLQEDVSRAEGSIKYNPRTGGSKVMKDFM